MTKRDQLDEEAIIQTAEVIHDFYGRNMERALQKMDRNFMFIGGQDFQWAESKAEFQRLTTIEATETPVMVYNEEYHVLLRDRTICVVYGRYHLTTTLENGSVLYAHARATYVWKVKNGALRLMHVHGSHAQDVPLEQSRVAGATLDEKSPLLMTMRDISLRQYEPEKLQFRDRTNHYYFVYPIDVFFLQAERQWSSVCTRSGLFQMRGVLKEIEQTLPDCFMRIHKSYVVNLRQVKSVSRFSVLLFNGQTLPVSRERYQALKQALAVLAAEKVPEKPTISGHSPT